MATYNTVSADNIYVQSTINIAGDTGTDKYVIANNGGTPVWNRTTGLVSQYTDNSDGVQDLAGTEVKVIFDTETFNFANVKFTGDEFEFNDEGLYGLSFQCLVSGATYQTAISFFINGRQVYGNIIDQPNSSDMSASIEYVTQINRGDILTVVGEKISGGPTLLRFNPLYRTPVTQLIIERLF